MKYYIIKPKNAHIQDELLKGIFMVDKDPQIVVDLERCDVAVLQQGWTRSKDAIDERDHAFYDLKKTCREGYVYTDKFKVRLA